MSQQFNLIPGENGTLAYSAEAVGDNLVTLFFSLVRDNGVNKLTTQLIECLNAPPNAPSDTHNNILLDLFVMMIQTRDCRGGKGEKLQFYRMFIMMNELFPSTISTLIPLIKEYGSFRDYFVIDQLIHSVSDEALSPSLLILSQKILDFVANQLIEDEMLYDKCGADKSKVSGLSFCAKYAPRESTSLSGEKNRVVKQLVARLFGSTAVDGARKKYRKLLSKLSAALVVPESFMCAKRYRDISFDRVPSQCLNKNRKAFLNELVPNKRAKTELDSLSGKESNIEDNSEIDLEVTGDRFPRDEDRVKCRENLRESVKNKKVKGKQLQPHELVKLLMSKRGGKLTVLDRDLYDAQWMQIRQALEESLASVMSSEEKKKGSVNLGKMCPLVDVSGSMSGIPMEVAIALGILVSEVTHPHFRHRFISFESTPQWIDLSDCSNIVDKVLTTQRSPWGNSTDIAKAFELVLKVCVKHQLPLEEVPDMIIFSDMQFDSAVGRRGEVMLQSVQRRFRECGYPDMPRIVFWNLRGDDNNNGYPATANSEGVQMLSGFSPALLKAVMQGDPVEEDVVTEDGVVVVGEKVKKSVTPYETLRKVLDDARYDLVRETLHSSTASCLEIDRFVKARGEVNLTEFGIVVDQMKGSTSNKGDSTSSNKGRRLKR